MIGQTISHYRITEKLGEGGMGEVYLATDTKLNRPVALKFLPSSFAGDPETRERFTREARSAAAVRHPSVVTIFEIQEHNDRPFIVMEYVSGVTLREWSFKHEHSLDETVRLFVEICDGVKSAHDLGIVHRDLKPDNIIIDINDHARVLDFGLARVRGASKLTRDGSTVGTAAYMAPEQIEGAAVDERADIWSLGVIFFEVLTGQNPFLRDFEHATMYAVLNESPQAPASIKPSIPIALSALVTRMLARRREDRCAFLSEVIGELHSQSLTSTQRPVEELGLVVLPFEDISPSKDNEYFSDGLTEEIIADLSKIRSLRVISRTSAMRYKGTQKNVREIGRELGVSHVLEGSVRKAGDKLRITAQLIEASSDRHLWAEKYSGSLDDIFEIQEQVAGAIANAMQLTLTKQEQESLAAHPIDDPRAYDCYLQARHDMKWTEERLNSAKNKLEIGLEIVGENAVLYAGMAQLYYQYVNAGYHQDESIAKAEEYVRKAFELAPDLPSAHLVAGQLAQAFKGEQQSAVDHFKRALSQTPNDSEVLFWLIIGYGVYGRIKEAGPLLDLAERIDPFNPVTHMARGWIHFTDGDFDGALTASKRSYAIEPSPMSGFLVALNMVYAGRMDDVLKLKPSLEKLSFFLDRVMLMYVYGHEKRFDEAAALVNDDLIATSRRDCQWSWHLAAGYAAIEQYDLALDWIDNAVNRGFMNHRMLSECDPYLTRLSDDPRYRAIVDRARRAWGAFRP